MRNRLAFPVFALHVVTVGRVPTESGRRKKACGASKRRVQKDRLERLAADWIALAEQAERIDDRKFPPREDERK
jgi:hypothetical protein